MGALKLDDVSETDPEPVYGPPDPNARSIDMTLDFKTIVGGLLSLAIAFFCGSVWQQSNTLAAHDIQLKNADNNIARLEQHIDKSVDIVRVDLKEHVDLRIRAVDAKLDTIIQQTRPNSH